MPKNKTEAEPRRKQTIDAVVMFTVLMHAYERGDLLKAVDAQTELARLGVLVRVLWPMTGAEKGGRHD